MVGALAALGKGGEPLEHHHADLGDVRLHYVTAGAGFPVVLLHGWPQSWYEWRKVIPGLAARFRVIAPDLRGLGESSRPADGYDKKTVGGDVWRLVHDVLGLDAFYLVGHDWGGPTAYAVASAHPEGVRKLVILDVTIPGDGSPGISQGGRRWHHAFHQTLDLPEALVTGREDIYLGWFYRTYGAVPLAEADIAEYLRVYRQPGALRAGFSYYRAIPQDMADNASVTARLKLPMPVLALGGDRSWGRRMEVVESLRRMAVDVQGGMVENCGHWMPEEQPDELLRRLLEFFGPDT
jgi:pimeloyl-ACP methyl ester carboxylesterase